MRCLLLAVFVLICAFTYSEANSIRGFGGGSGGRPSCGNKCQKLVDLTPVIKCVNNALNKLFKELSATLSLVAHLGVDILLDLLGKVLCVSLHENEIPCLVSKSCNCFGDLVHSLGKAGEDVGRLLNKVGRLAAGALRILAELLFQILNVSTFHHEIVEYFVMKLLNILSLIFLT
jgi:hypothetical protein